MSRRITFVHASPAALPPLSQYFAANGPEFEITNLLDDGLLRHFRSGAWAEAERRLLAMLSTGHTEYEAELAMLTCSAVPIESMARIRQQAPLPVLKIDEAMARHAASACTRIGLVVSFPPTLPSTTDLLVAAATAIGKTVTVESIVVPEALQALLDNDTARHDALLAPAILGMNRRDVDGIVLAQVSMARLVGELQPQMRVPLFDSLSSSLKAIRESLNPAGARTA